MKSFTKIFYFLCIVYLFHIQLFLAQPSAHEVQQKKATVPTIQTGDKQVVGTESINKFSEAQQNIKNKLIDVSHIFKNSAFWKKAGALSAGAAALLGSIYWASLQTMNQEERVREQYKTPQDQTLFQFLKHNIDRVKTLPEFNRAIARMKKYYGMQEFINANEGQEIIKRKLITIIIPLQERLNKIYEKMSEYPLFNAQKVWQKEPYMLIPLKRIKMIEPFPFNQASLTNVKISIDARTTLGENALMHALIGGDVDLAQSLIDNGINLNARRSDGQTALLIGLSRPQSSLLNITKATRLLLEANLALANMVDNQGFTPLMYAGIFDRPDIVMRDLINAGASYKATNKLGFNVFQVSRADGVRTLRTILGERKAATL